MYILNSIVMNIGSDTAFYEKTTFVNWNTIIFNNIFFSEWLLTKKYFLEAIFRHC